jgi:outer membrane lipoprotein-sorting protein
MRIPSPLFFLAVPVLLTPLSYRTAAASPPEVMTIVQDMQKVLEPDRPSVRKIEISVSGESGFHARWEARKASRTFPEGKRALLVLLAPPEVRGSVLLVQEPKGKDTVRWVYVPIVRRSRKILGVTAYEPFLSTDFTYADLGFLDDSGTYRLLGEEARADQDAYKVEFTPESAGYYPRVVTWVSKDTHLPLERDYYDVSGQLWKKELFEQVKVIGGIPTPLRIVMKDLLNDTQTVLDISRVRYDVDIPGDLFNPETMSRAADSMLWEELEPATGSR